MRSRLGTMALFLRQFTSDRGAALTVAVVVMAVALASALAPRMLDDVFTADLHEELAATPPTIRDVSTISAPGPPMATEGPVWAHFEAELERVRGTAPAVVRAALGAGRFTVASRTFAIDPGAAEATVEIFTKADTGAADMVDLVDGDRPAPIQVAADGAIGPVEVMISREAAEAMAWGVGETRSGSGEMGGLDLLTYRLSGVYEPRDADDETWTHHLASAAPAILDHFDRGVTVTAAAYVDPESWPALAPLAAGAGETRIWYPLDPSALRAADAEALLAGLRQFQSATHPIGQVPGPSRTLTGLVLTTEADAALEAAIDRRTGSTAVMAIVAVGPLGVSLAVLALAVRLLLERRGAALSLTAARGASSLQLRTVLAAEGLLLGLPVAAAMLWLASVLVPSAQGGAVGVALPLLVGLTPAALLAVLGRARGLRSVRRDLSGARAGALRRTAEALVVGAAVLTAVALNLRGVVPESTGFDPLLAATPLLLALAAGVLVLRLYPVPLAAVGRRFRARRGTMAYLGTARAVRDPAGGLAPMLALVVGLSIAAFSTVVWSTTHHGGLEAARDVVGADARVSGPAVTESERAAATQHPDIETVVTVTDAGPTRFSVGAQTPRPTLIVVDVAALQGLHRAAPGLQSVPDGLVGLVDGAVPMLVSDDVGAVGTEGELVASTPVPAEVMAVGDRVSGLPTSGSWAVVDRETLAAAGVEAPDSRLALVDLTATARDASGVEATLGEGRNVSTVEDVASRQGGPISEGTATAIVVAIALSGVLCAAAMVLAAVLSAPTRLRLLAQLHTLGVSGRQGAGLVAWEVTPTAAVSMAAGIVLGVGLPWVVFGGIDLRSLTGGGAQPRIHVPLDLLAVVTAGFVLVVAVAVAGSVLAARWRPAATVLRIGDDT